MPTICLAQENISEVTVIYGGSAGIQCPAGYTKVNVDLNRNAGGDYIYVCYKKGLGAPVTRLAVTYNNDSPPLEYAWTRINVDLNRGAGGDFVWLWYTKDPDCTVVDDILVQLNNSTFPEGYIGDPHDMNYGVGGDFIYIGYSKN
jgi:hypothetical protein